MTNDAIRIAIGKELGWEQERGVTEYDGFKMPWTVYHKDGETYNPRDFPNWPEDLNACAELCNVLAKAGWKAELGNGLDTTWECQFINDRDSHYGAADSMAGAICEAYLRCIDRWLESTPAKSTHSDNGGA